MLTLARDLFRRLDEIEKRSYITDPEVMSRFREAKMRMRANNPEFFAGVPEPLPVDAAVAQNVQRRKQQLLQGARRNANAPTPTGKITGPVNSTMQIDQSYATPAVKARLAQVKEQLRRQNPEFHPQAVKMRAAPVTPVPSARPSLIQKATRAFRFF